jgi:NAD(P)-dependent dehydrogenase (short-subunit alcohol dehydrogenase family)
MSVALITGGSAGLGRALVRGLAARGWRVITDGRDQVRLEEATVVPNVVAIPGDITDANHRRSLRLAVEEAGGLDLLVHNASTLGPDTGPTRLRRLANANADQLDQVLRMNVGAPLALTAELLPILVASEGILVSVSSDAAVEHYEGWGLYGASKAGLDHVTLTFGAENPAITAYAVDPGDMRTQMHQDAFPGEDISDRPLPETVVPHLLELIETRPPSGRYRAADIPVATPVGS